MRAPSSVLVPALLLCLVGCAGDDDDEVASSGMTSGPPETGDPPGSEAGGETSAADAETSAESSAGAGEFLGSCDTRTQGEDIVLGQCRDWTGEPGPDLSVSCGGIGGVFSDANMCPTDERVGTCALDPVLGVVAIYNFYAPTTAMEALETCEGLEGAWAEG